MTRSAEQSPAVAAHALDFISLGKIVQIRERLLQAQAAGKVVFRFESGDPSFAPAPHVSDAIIAATHAGKTHYIPNNGIPELRKALAEKCVAKNGLAGVTSNDIYVTNGAMRSTSRSARCSRKVTKSSSPTRCGRKSPRTSGWPAVWRLA